MIKKIIKKIAGKKTLSLYHLAMAKMAAWYYKNPSDRLIVIGVTGTNGKTATVNFVSQYLDHLGIKNGLASTVNFKVADQEWINDKKMTMLGRFQTQKLLAQMVKENCKYAVIETSSQGVEQFRHVGINYDLVIFTNLTPEHIEAHGSFDKYRECKENLFRHLVNGKRKKIDDQKIDKIIVSNQDDEETKRLKLIKADKFVTYSIYNDSDFRAKDTKIDNGVSFSLNGKRINTKLMGQFNIYNVLSAITALVQFGFDLGKISTYKANGVPGRQEWIDEGQDFGVLVDYAPEPASLKQLYKALKGIEHNKLIHVLGSCGGGRDKARQPILGNMAGNYADFAIITNEDPYDDDPMEIIDNVALGAEESGKIEGQSLFKILDRKKAIKKAIDLAKTGDLIIITGKGAEQYICSKNGQKIDHDDRKVARELLKK